MTVSGKVMAFMGVGADVDARVDTCDGRLQLGGDRCPGTDEEVVQGPRLPARKVY